MVRQSGHLHLTTSHSVAPVEPIVAVFLGKVQWDLLAVDTLEMFTEAGTLEGVMDPVAALEALRIRGE